MSEGNVLVIKVKKNQNRRPKLFELCKRNYRGVGVGLKAFMKKS